MKKIVILSLTLFVVQLSIGQVIDIDKINTNTEAENLIHSFGKEYKSFKVKPIREFKSFGVSFCKRIADSLKINKEFYKCDFDKNGYTDILVAGVNYSDFYIFVVMNYKDNVHKIKTLTRGLGLYCEFPKIINNSIIEHHYMDYPKLLNKKLIYKFGDFIELNENVKKYNVKEIEYRTTGCYGTCSEFKLIIRDDRTAFFNAIEYNSKTEDSEELKGNFTCQIDKKSYLELVDLLNYIDFPNLKDEYAVNWTDDQSSLLIVTYDNRKVKFIEDYGLLGTYGLDRLYQMLFDLRFNQKWEKTE
ncbi:MAG: hypothetical protein KGV44_02015 [Flavobacteriaceae bacterium]|nr:hypothetical protein [Flavobacteriaceae bacterium]